MPANAHGEIVDIREFARHETVQKVMVETERLIAECSQSDEERNLLTYLITEKFLAKMGFSVIADWNRKSFEEGQKNVYKVR